jgi:hypothetical protein
MQIHTTIRNAAAGGLAALVLGLAGPAAATPSSTLFVGGGGIAADDGAGSIVVEGPGLVQDKHLREMLDATLRATMAPVDQTMPAIGECEPAVAGVVVDGVRDTDMTLRSDGTVCHLRHPVFTSYVWVEYRGIHEVTQAKRPQLRGVTGSLSITVSPGGFTSVHADSFVPTS